MNNNSRAFLFLLLQIIIFFRYGISETASATLKAGMEKAKEVDGKYGVSETVTAKVKEVDEKYGVSQKIKEVPELVFFLLTIRVYATGIICSFHITVFGKLKAHINPDILSCKHLSI